MEEKVSDQPKSVEPEQKLLPQVDEEGLPKARKGEGQEGVGEGEEAK